MPDATQQVRRPRHVQPTSSSPPARHRHSSNGYIGAFNSRVRDECLNINWSLAQARVVISDWKADYNHRRRHPALGY
jgi:transposase InsO family protein